MGLALQYVRTYAERGGVVLKAGSTAHRQLDVIAKVKRAYYLTDSRNLRELEG